MVFFTFRMNMLAALMVVAFTISGCQSTSKWATAWQDRSKPQSEFKDPNETERVTYWPYRSVKNKQKMTPVPDKLQEKVAQRSSQNKRDAELADLINEGDLLRSKNQLENARQVYQKALALSPENADIHRRLAIVGDLQGNFSVADEYYQTALKLRPRDVDILSDKGYSFILRGNPHQAEMVLREALLIDPSHKLAMANLAAVYAKQNRYQETLAMFRAGGTEAEAQRNVAKFFPQGSDVAMASGTQDASQSTVNPAVGSAANVDPPDLKNFTIEQIQAEMARRRQEARQRRFEADQQALQRRAEIDQQEIGKFRDFSDADEVDMRQGVVQQQGGSQTGTTRGNGANGVMTIGPRTSDPRTANNPPISATLQRQGVVLQPGLTGQETLPQDNIPPMNQRFQTQQDRSLAGTQGSTRNAEIFRGPSSQPARQMDPQSQRGWNAQGAGAVNNGQPPMDMTTSQMVTQLGMSVGPGSLFPAPPPTGGVGLPPQAFDSRFGAELSHDPAMQDSPNQFGQNGSRNQAQPRGGSNSNSSDDGLTIGPPSPANNWGPPSMTSGPNWQNNSPDSSMWSNESQPGNAAANGVEQQGRAANQEQFGFRSDWGRVQTRRSPDGFDNRVQQQPSQNRYRNGNDAARPYNGAWPNSNSLPLPQNQFGPDETSRFDPIDSFGGQGNAGGTNPVLQNGQTGNTLPLWPSGPNR